MAVQPGGTATVTRDEQPQDADSPIWVHLRGIAAVTRELQSENAPSCLAPSSIVAHFSVTDTNTA
jgi:hypothetical protein